MQITTQNPLQLIAGGPAEHVTVDDQNGNPLPPADIAWTLPEGVTATADATGFLVQAAASVAPGAQSEPASYSGPGATNGPVSGSLAIEVIAGVTGLTFTSP